jgi:flavin-dependent dehydrogenase
VRVPLERLGAWDRFEAGGHLPSPGILAAWGQPEPYANDFILNPYGCGWRVDRNRFDAVLAAGACDAGAIVLTRTVVEGCRRAAGGGWELAVTGHALSAGCVVDATGRSSSFCRFVGGRRVVYDRLVALVGFATPVPPADRRALIEATEDGWWYSAPIPDGRLVMAFQTDAGPGLRARWDGFLAAAPATAARAGAAAAGGVRVVPAHTRRTEPVAGEGWLAVGDAATAHDPVAGLGIHWALESGIAGAEAILAGPAGVAGYGADMAERFDRYLTTRTLYYRAEHRWPDAPFWRRRHEGR